MTALTSPGNISQRGILGSTFEPDIQMGSKAIWWVKVRVGGVVHEFKDGKDHLQEQAASFQGCTAVFADQGTGGNALLKLRDVQLWYRHPPVLCHHGRGSRAAVLHYRMGGEGYEKENRAASCRLAWLDQTYSWLRWCWKLL